MPKICIRTTTKTLRAGTPAARIGEGAPAGGTQAGSEYTMVLQTFGVENKEITTYKATTELLASKDFIGMNPVGEYESANYNATVYIDAEGNTVFQGTEVKVPTYSHEDTMPYLDKVFV